LSGKQGFDFRLVSDKDDFHTIFTRGHYRTDHIRFREVVTPHGVYNDTSHPSSPYISGWGVTPPNAKVLLDNQSNLIIIRPARALVLELADRHA
jgi:hypothetical protein